MVSKRNQLQQQSVSVCDLCLLETDFLCILWVIHRIILLVCYLKVDLILYKILFNRFAWIWKKFLEITWIFRVRVLGPFWRRLCVTLVGNRAIVVSHEISINFSQIQQIFLNIKLTRTRSTLIYNSWINTNQDKIVQ